MIDKAEFYHGAALVRAIEDPRCLSIHWHDSGYVVNDKSLVHIKYTTRTHSPWRFTISKDDEMRLERGAQQFAHCVVAFVCGGDGVCAIPWCDLQTVLGDPPAWIAAKRAFSACYAVSGPGGTLRHKVALNRWPEILFEGIPE